jgi:hypothetical protein
VFLLAQVLDGILTYIGVSQGTPEGNPLIEFMIAHMGLLSAIVCAKVFASAIGIALYAFNGTRQLVFLNLLMWGAAVLPWTLHLAGVW